MCVKTKSLQQFQEEVALNGLPSAVTIHTPGQQKNKKTNSSYVSVQIVAPAAANRTSNKRHLEIKIKVCIFYKKNKRHIVFQLFLESP